jgi:membrane-associated protease RseP (regulator of RpoE activity)
MSYFFYIFQKKKLKVKNFFITMGPKKVSEKKKGSRKLLTIEQKKK